MTKQTRMIMMLRNLKALVRMVIENVWLKRGAQFGLQFFDIFGQNNSNHRFIPNYRAKPIMSLKWIIQ